MQRIEIEAGRQFVDVGLAAVASDEPYDDEELQSHIDAGAAWIAEADGVIAGYAVASVVDGDGHLDQVSALPEFRGLGVGRRLIGEVVEWTRRHGLPAVTLTTFVDVPWNGPYYARLGFVEMTADETGPELTRIRAEEAERGLDALQKRVAMRLEL